jgi:hypothetical protein
MIDPSPSGDLPRSLIGWRNRSGYSRSLINDRHRGEMAYLWRRNRPPRLSSLAGATDAPE